MTETHGASSASAGRATAVLTIGALVSGLAAYAFVTVGNRTLGAATFAPVSVVWSLWAATVAFLTFPLQHLTVGSLVGDPSGADLRRLVPGFVRLSFVVSVGTGLVSALASGPLFGSTDWRFPLAVGLSTLGSGAMGVVRGTYAGRGRYLAAASAMGGENVVRLIAAIVVGIAGLGPGTLALALATGPLAVAVGVRWLWAQWRAGPATGAPTVATTIRLADVVSVGGGTLVSQVVLSGPPILLATLGADPVTVTSTFAAITAFRAPYLLGLGAGLRAMAWFADVASAQGPGPLRIWAGRLLLGGLAVGAAGGVLAARVGLPVLRGLFGPTIDLEPLQLGLVAAGCLLALASLGVVLIAVAMHRSTTILNGWIAAAVLGGVVIVFGRSQPADSVVLGFAVAELAALVLVSLSILRER